MNRKFLSVLSCLVVAVPLVACADLPGKHPYYLHALSDLRAARWMLEDRPGRLHKALELLRKTKADVAREEDDPAVRGLRDRAVGHIDGAIHATEHAIGDVRQGR